MSQTWSRERPRTGVRPAQKMEVGPCCHAFRWEHSHTLLEAAQQATVIFWADLVSAHLREGDAHGEGEHEDHAQRQHGLVERVGAA